MKDFYEAAHPGPEHDELRAAMLEVDLIALRLRVAVAKADVQLRSTRWAMLRHSGVERLLSHQAREDQHHHLQELRAAVTQYAHLLRGSGESRNGVVCLVRESIEQVTTDTLENAIVSAAIAKALQRYLDAPAA